MEKGLKFLFIYLILFSLGCSKRYVQTFSTQSSKLKKSNGNWVFENDSLIITYDFNSNYGKMEFTVYNKLDIPIYLDWKNSSFIHNSLKNNYWVEETTTQSKSLILSKQRSIPITLIKSDEKSIKSERTTFIPPRSGISSNNSNYQFKLTNVQKYLVNPSKATSISVPNLTKKAKYLPGFEYTYSENESIIKFRNFLAFGLKENPNEFYFIDNSFYVDKFQELDSRSFERLKFRDKAKFYIDNIIHNKGQYKK